ncbi:MAG: hypothetical protein JW841_14285 [Deltaproteobacteria bacterium]|nr:hypothetical protein [Deltaproteobacteria bacterium]
MRMLTLIMLKLRSLNVQTLRTGITVLTVFTGLLFISSCEKDDIGKPCPQLLGDTEATSDDESQTKTAEIVSYDPSFPCDELICIATSGRSGYCSKRCRDNSVCPDGFECREVQPVGEFAGQKYCAWKPCNTASDCGSKSDFCCQPVLGSGTAADMSYCAFKTGGQCE